MRWVFGGDGRRDWTGVRRHPGAGSHTCAAQSAAGTRLTRPRCGQSAAMTSPFVHLVPTRLVVVCAAGAAVLALTGCSDDGATDTEPGAGGTDAAATLRAAMVESARALTCPRSDGQQPDVSVALSGLDETSLDAYRLEAGAEGRDDVAEVWCVQVAAVGLLDPAPTSLTFEAPDDPSNYGASYSTGSDGAEGSAGSEEITYSPFVVGVLGPCRTVTAELVLADGTRHRAGAAIGSECPAG